MVDVDECGINIFHCSHICVNTEGSAYCICTDGFELTGDYKTCTGSLRFGGFLPFHVSTKNININCH